MDHLYFGKSIGDTLAMRDRGELDDYRPAPAAKKALANGEAPNLSSGDIRRMFRRLWRSRENMRPMSPLERVQPA